MTEHPPCSDTPPADRHRRLLHSAIASALALGLGAGAAQAHQGKPNEEVCYGIAKAGENKCSNLLGTHECAGESTVDNAIDEWTYVPKGSCKRLKGHTKAEAEAKLRQMQAKAAALTPAPSPTTKPVPAPGAAPAPSAAVLPAPAPAPTSPPAAAAAASAARPVPQR